MAVTSGSTEPPRLITTWDRSEDAHDDVRHPRSHTDHLHGSISKLRKNDYV